jgi:hypothetical protein
MAIAASLISALLSPTFSNAVESTSPREITFKKELLLRVALNSKAKRKFPLILVDGKPLKGIKCTARDAIKPFGTLKVDKSIQALLFCIDDAAGGIVARENFASRDIPLAQIEAEGANRTATTSKVVHGKDQKTVIFVATIVQGVEEHDPESLGPRTPPQVHCDGGVKEFTWNDKLKLIDGKPSRKKLTAFFGRFTGMNPICQKKWKKM